MTPQQAQDKLLLIQHIISRYEEFTYHSMNNSIATIDFHSTTWIEPLTLRKLITEFPQIFISESRMFIWLD